jgi:hypothetical protein
VGIRDTFDQTLINGMLQIFNFGAALAGAFLVDRLGRRTLFLWSTIGMLITYTIWTACSAVNYERGDSKAGIVVVVCLFIFYFHYDIAWTPLLFGVIHNGIYQVENAAANNPHIVSDRDFPLSSPCQRSRDGVLLQLGWSARWRVCQPHWNGESRLAVLYCLLLHSRSYPGRGVLPVSGDKGHSLEIAVIFDCPNAETSLAMDKRVEAAVAEHKENAV